MGSCLSFETRCEKCSMEIMPSWAQQHLCIKCRFKQLNEKGRLASIPKKYRKYRTVDSSESLDLDFPTIENQTFESIDIKQIIDTGLHEFYERFNQTKEELKNRLEVEGYVNDMTFSLKNVSYTNYGYESDDLRVSLTVTAWRELTDKEKEKLEIRLEKKRKETEKKRKLTAEKTEIEEHKHYLKLKKKYEQKQTNEKN